MALDSNPDIEPKDAPAIEPVNDLPTKILYTVKLTNQMGAFYIDVKQSELIEMRGDVKNDFGFSEENLEGVTPEELSQLWVAKTIAAGEVIKAHLKRGYGGDDIERTPLMLNGAQVVYFTVHQGTAY